MKTTTTPATSPDETTASLAHRLARAEAREKTLRVHLESIAQMLPTFCRLSDANGELAEHTIELGRIVSHALEHEELSEEYPHLRETSHDA